MKNPFINLPFSFAWSFSNKSSIASPTGFFFLWSPISFLVSHKSSHALFDDFYSIPLLSFILLLQMYFWSGVVMLRWRLDIKSHVWLLRDFIQIIKINYFIYHRYNRHTLIRLWKQISISCKSLNKRWDVCTPSLDKNEFEMNCGRSLFVSKVYLKRLSIKFVVNMKPS